MSSCLQTFPLWGLPKNTLRILSPPYKTAETVLSTILSEMSRLIVLALLASTAMAVFQPSLNSPIAYRLNARMMELYNAKDFPRLVNEVRREN